MQIHRDIKPLVEKLDDIQNTLIVRVFAKIHKDGFTQFQAWASAFMEGSEETLKKWEALRPFIRFPV